MPNKFKQWENGKAYAEKLSLLATIESEVEPKLAEMRKADDILDRVTRAHNGVTSQGYSNLAGCSRLDVYTVGHLRGTESLISSDSFDACAIAGMVKAEETTRNVADNN